MLSLLPLPAQLVSFSEGLTGCPVKHSWIQLDLYLYAVSICHGKGMNLRFVTEGGEGSVPHSVSYWIYSWKSTSWTIRSRICSPRPSYMFVSCSHFRKLVKYLSGKQFSLQTSLLLLKESAESSDGWE